MTAPAVSKPAPVEEIRVGRPRIPAGQLMEVGQFRRHFWIKLPPGMTAEDVQYSESWSHLVRQLVRHDLVTLMAADESWELEVCVESVSMTGVEVSTRKKIGRKGIVSVVTPVAEGFHAEWSHRDGWHVVREKDGHIVTRGHNLASSAIAQWQREQPRPAA